METMNWPQRVVDSLESYSGRVILAAVALTLLLIIPLVAMAPDEEASSDPGGDVFDLQDDIDDRFESLIHSNGYIVEARGGEVLTQPALWELYQTPRSSWLPMRGVSSPQRLCPPRPTSIRPSIRIPIAPSRA